MSMVGSASCAEATEDSRAMPSAQAETPRESVVRIMMLLLLARRVEPARTEGICGVERRSSVGQEKAGGARDDQELAQPLSRAGGPISSARRRAGHERRRKCGGSPPRADRGTAARASRVPPQQSDAGRAVIGSAWPRLARGAEPLDAELGAEAIVAPTRAPGRE